MPGQNLKECLLKTPSRDKWERIGVKKRAGILSPLFSLYSKKSIGIGEFSDLKLLIDWAKKTGLSIIQLLPLNEVGPLFCPYDSLSSFALEPVYLALGDIPGSDKNSIIRAKINRLKREFPAGKPYLDYRIKKAKIDLLWNIFLAAGAPDDKDLEKFRADNNYWINDFALFRALKDYHGGKSWYEWEERYKNRNLTALQEFSTAHAKEILFQIWLQRQAYKQFKGVKKYAQAKGILLKGDLPFLVSRDSADVWQHPDFFKLEFAAGAPADMYCAKGQRWGMPTYNWEKVAADDYRYLKEKLKYAQEFYNILRIDHVVGLFRIWSIPYNEPLENQGLYGFFDPADENKWERQGRSILSVMLNNTSMLLCAEDLGMIPEVCKRVLRELGIPGNDVQRWTKDWKVKHDFLSPRDYRVLCVAMLSTHDTTNWRAWWEVEAGTVDAELFIRKCTERGIDYNSVKDKLFDLARSQYARLRWLDGISSVDILTAILGKSKDEVADFVEIYENTYREKEKLFRQLKLSGPMPDSADTDMVRAALKITLGSSALFCIELIADWMYLANVFKAEAYQYRINTPGTISAKNWSLVIPVSLEHLMKHRVTKEIKELVNASLR